MSVEARTLHTAAVAKSTVAARLVPVETAIGIWLGYESGPARVDVRIAAGGRDRAQALRRLDTAERRARETLGAFVHGVDEHTLDREVHRLLAEREATLAVAESLTGGLLGAELTAMPGSSATFLGGVTAYATPLKEALLGVPEELLAEHGAVHPEVAAAMAVGVRARLGSGYGLAVTGVAGPEPQDGRPAGTVHIAVADPQGTVTACSPRLAGPATGGRARTEIREMTVVHALDLLRRRLLGLGPAEPVEG